MMATVFKFAATARSPRSSGNESVKIWPRVDVSAMKIGIGEPIDGVDL
jgi:hypothetical protein